MPAMNPSDLPPHLPNIHCLCPACDDVRKDFAAECLRKDIEYTRMRRAERGVSRKLVQARARRFRRRARFHELATPAQAAARKLIAGHKSTIRQSMLCRGQFDARLAAHADRAIPPGSFEKALHERERAGMASMRAWYDDSVKRHSLLASLMLHAAKRRRW